MARHHDTAAPGPPPTPPDGPHPALFGDPLPVCWPRPYLVNGYPVPSDPTEAQDDLMTPEVAHHLRHIHARADLIGYGSYKVVYPIGAEDGSDSPVEHVARVYREHRDAGEARDSAQYVSSADDLDLDGPPESIGDLTVERQKWAGPVSPLGYEHLCARLEEQGLLWRDAGMRNAGITRAGRVVRIDGHLQRLTRCPSNLYGVYRVVDGNHELRRVVAAVEYRAGGRAYFTFGADGWTHSPEAAGLFTTPTAKLREFAIRGYPRRRQRPRTMHRRAPSCGYFLERLATDGRTPADAGTRLYDIYRCGESVTRVAAVTAESGEVRYSWARPGSGAWETAPPALSDIFAERPRRAWAGLDVWWADPASAQEGAASQAVPERTALLAMEVPSQPRRSVTRRNLRALDRAVLSIG